MGNNNSVMECCGPCTVVRDKKNTLDIDMEDQKMQDPFETSFDGIDHSLLSNSAFQESRERKQGGGFSFGQMTRQDYFLLYDAIHSLVRSRKISKEEENKLYDLIGKQDPAIAMAFQKYKVSGDTTSLQEIV
uniref:Uncharacterized protein n=1 Tax=Guillardia theta TaxID=55529 RepID=A0A7S4PJ68_GUITH|mmetsp:Transcript_52352/g.162503  ORF Transcript_52352/g.162503 Transcript_52352/m.162503 type:complete len:132 (+) Transcript_52352:349-744(+)